MTPINKAQLYKIIKTALYVGASAVIAYLITLLDKNPDALGIYTAIVNVVLVTLKQAFTAPQE
nr:MAG TPA: hypothetical protein [Caudoviricetes sp.]